MTVKKNHLNIKREKQLNKIKFNLWINKNFMNNEIWQIVKNNALKKCLCMFKKCFIIKFDSYRKKLLGKCC